MGAWLKSPSFHRVCLGWPGARDDARARNAPVVDEDAEGFTQFLYQLSDSVPLVRELEARGFGALLSVAPPGVAPSRWARAVELRDGAQRLAKLLSERVPGLDPLAAKHPRGRQALVVGLLQLHQAAAWAVQQGIDQVTLWPVESQQLRQNATVALEMVRFDMHQADTKPLRVDTPSPAAPQPAPVAAPAEPAPAPPDKAEKLEKLETPKMRDFEEEEGTEPSLAPISMAVSLLARAMGQHLEIQGWNLEERWVWKLSKPEPTMLLVGERPEPSGVGVWVGFPSPVPEEEPEWKGLDELLTPKLAALLDLGDRTYFEVQSPDDAERIAAQLGPRITIIVAHLYVLTGHEIPRGNLSPLLRGDVELARRAAESPSVLPSVLTAITDVLAGSQSPERGRLLELVASHVRCPTSLLGTLAGDKIASVRACVARNPRAPASALARLADDPDPTVKAALASR